MATEYLVLSSDGGVWREVERRKAHSPRGAIQGALLDRIEEKRADSYVAVPLRSWQPVQLRVETKPRVVFGGEVQPASRPSEARKEEQ